MREMLLSNATIILCNDPNLLEFSNKQNGKMRKRKTQGVMSKSIKDVIEQQVLFRQAASKIQKRAQKRRHTPLQSLGRIVI